jgi:bla regulator protein BlaR1
MYSRASRTACLLLSLAVAMCGAPLAAQDKTPAAVDAAESVGPAFEVATIRPGHTDVGPGGWMGMRLAPSGRLMARSMSLKSLIWFAYLPKPGSGKVEGGPKWADSDRYDIEAKVDDAQMVGWEKLSDGERMDRVRPMLRELLAARFHLQLHTEMRVTPVYAMVQAKGGTKLKEVPAPAPLEGDGDAMEKMMRQMKEHPGTPSPGSIHCTGNGCAGHAMQMSGAVGQIAGSSRLDGIAVDETGLKGYYDFSYSVSGDPDAPAPVDQIEQQLGLRFEARKVPMKTWIIDSAEKPSEN